MRNSKRLPIDAGRFLSVLFTVLRDHFNGCDKQASLKEYLHEVIEHSGATLEHLVREFHLDESDLKNLLQ